MMTQAFPAVQGLSASNKQQLSEDIATCSITSTQRTSSTSSCDKQQGWWQGEGQEGQQGLSSSCSCCSSRTAATAA
jgi:hypothetical protein